jgi:hypothetical protein
MAKTITIRVDETLRDLLERIRKDVADNMKKEYGLNEVTVGGTFASQILAAQRTGKKVLRFKIEKAGLNKGVLHLI